MRQKTKDRVAAATEKIPEVGDQAPPQACRGPAATTQADGKNKTREEWDWAEMLRTIDRYGAGELVGDLRTGVAICASIDQFDGTDSAKIRTEIADQREQLLGKCQTLLEPYRLSLVIRYFTPPEWGDMAELSKQAVEKELAYLQSESNFSLRMQLLLDSLTRLVDFLHEQSLIGQNDGAGQLSSGEFVESGKETTMACNGPTYAGNFIIGSVYEVNGDGAVIVPELRITRYEAETICEHWLLEAADCICWCHFNQGSGSSESRRISHGLARSRQLADRLGPNAMRKAMQRVVPKLQQNCSAEDRETIVEILRSYGLDWNEETTS